MSAAKQIGAVVSMNVRAMRVRLGASLVIVVGMAAVVATALSLFSMSAGLMQTIKGSSSPDRMVVMSQGARDGAPSNLPRDQLAIIADTPGIMKGPDGKPVVSASVNTNYLTKRRRSGAYISVPVTGVTGNVEALRPEFKILEGRMFKPGLREVIAGQGAVKLFQNVELGKQIVLQDGPWTIVGIFEVSRAFDARLFTDADTLMGAQRRNSFIVVHARLEEGTKAAQDAFKATLESSPSVSVDVETEEENFARAAATGRRFYQILAYGVGAVMALGTVFAALNVMYAAVAARLMEIATLRAIGFGATPVVISIVVEALGLAVVGAIVGALIAWTLFDGRSQDFLQISIDRAVTPAMMATGIGISLLVGLIGALFPAIRAGRLPVTTALQVR